MEQSLFICAPAFSILASAKLLLRSSSLQPAAIATMMLRLLICACGAAALVAPPTARQATRLQATVAEATGGANAKLIDDLAARTKDAGQQADDLIPCADDDDLKTWLARFLGDDGDVDAAEAKVRGKYRMAYW